MKHVTPALGNTALSNLGISPLSHSPLGVPRAHESYLIYLEIQTASGHAFVQWPGTGCRVTLRDCSAGRGWRARRSTQPPPLPSLLVCCFQSRCCLGCHELMWMYVFSQDFIKAQDLSDLENTVAALKSEFQKTLNDPQKTRNPWKRI